MPCSLWKSKPQARIKADGNGHLSYVFQVYMHLYTNLSFKFTNCSRFCLLFTFLFGWEIG